MVFAGCKKDEIPRPDVSSNEVGFVNETSSTAIWGMNETGNPLYYTISVSSNSTSKLPYSSLGYMVNPLVGSGVINPVFANGGQIIVLYEDGDYFKVRIE